MAWKIPVPASPFARQQPRQQQPMQQQPAQQQGVGLGTLIKRATSAVGIKPCGGCEERAEFLDQRVQFVPKGWKR